MTDEGIAPDERRLVRWALPLIITVAFAVRLYGLHSSLWMDETASLAFARQPLSHLWGEWMVRETNPPLFYTLLKGWQTLFGASDATARLLPIVIGLSGVWGIFLLGRAVGGTKAGLLGAALLATSAIHVDFSLQLRGYGLTHTGVVFACLAMVSFLREGGRKWLVLYVCAAGVALYAHTTLALFVALANGAMILLLRRDARDLGRWIAANLILAIVWSWWGWMTIRQLGLPHNFGWIPVPGVAEAWSMSSVALGPLYQRGATLGGVLILAIMLGGALMVAVRKAQPETTLLAILALGGPILMFVVSQNVAVFLPRTLFWASAPLLALVATGVVSLSNRRVAGVLAALLVALSGEGLIAWFPQGEQEQWRTAVAILEQDADGRDTWVADDAVALALAHYLPDAAHRVVVIERPGAPHERWAVGLFPGRHLGASEAQALFRTQCHVASVRRGEYDPGPLLTSAGGRARKIGTQTKNPFVALWDCGGGRGGR